MKMPSPRSAAFTLVELLVVMAIIALLISILLPALSKARQSALQLACLNHVRQIGQTLAVYQTEFNDYLPMYYDGHGNDNTAWGTRGSWHAILGYLYFNYGTISDNAADPTLHSRWNDARDRIFDCPGKNDSEVGNRYYRNDYAPAENLRKTSPSTYDNDPVKKIVRLTRAHRPSEKVYVAEADNPHFFRGTWIPHVSDLFAARHNEAANVLYGDAHAGLLKENEIGWTLPINALLFRDYYQ